MLLIVPNKDSDSRPPIPIFFDRVDDSLSIEILIGFTGVIDCKSGVTGDKRLHPTSSIMKENYAPIREISLDKFTDKVFMIEPELETLAPGMHYENHPVTLKDCTFGVCEFHGRTFYRKFVKDVKHVNLIHSEKISLSNRDELYKYWFKIKDELPEDSRDAVQALFFSPIDFLLAKVREIISSTEGVDVEKVKAMILPYKKLEMAAESAALLVSCVLAIFGPKSSQYQDIQSWAQKEISHKSLYRHLFHAVFTMGISDLCREKPKLWNPEAVNLVQGELIDFYLQARSHSDPCDEVFVGRVFQWVDGRPLDALGYVTFGELYSGIKIRNQQLEARERFLQKNLDPDAIQRAAVRAVSDFYLRARLQKSYQALQEKVPVFLNRGVLDDKETQSKIKTEIVTQWKSMVIDHQRLQSDSFATEYKQDLVVRKRNTN